MAFIIMKASLEDHHGFAPAGTEHKGAGMTLHSGLGEIRNVREGNRNPVFQGVGKITQAAAKDQADGGTQVSSGLQKIRGGVDTC